MSSIFDMNHKRICPICTDVHAVNVKCSYDLLMQIIHTMRGERMTLMKANREAVDVARNFQNLIVDMTVRLEELVEVSEDFKILKAACDKYPDGSLIIEYANEIKKESHGAEKLRTKTPDGDSKEVQRSEVN